jgi:hypothetical protein
MIRLVIIAILFFIAFLTNLSSMDFLFITTITLWNPNLTKTYQYIHIRYLLDEFFKIAIFKT